MDNIQILLTLVLIRLMIPFGILLLVGEWNRHREEYDRFRNEHHTDSILQSSVSLQQALENS